MYFRHTATLLLLVSMSLCATSQNTIGLPDVKNFSKQTYRAGAQNRQVVQDAKGILYFANTEGVLTYDGISWTVYPLPNRSIVRSLEFGPDNRLYVGGQDEFGYFSPDENGTLRFHSLKHIIPEAERSFTDVWNIQFYRDLIFFQTSTRIYQLSSNNCTVYKSIHWKFMTTDNDMLIAQDHLKGLLSFRNGVWSPFLEESELPGECFVSSLTRINQDSALVTTVRDGIYVITGKKLLRFQSAFLNTIKDKNISNAAMVNNDHIGVTTNLAGCFIIDKKGNLVQNFSGREGLQNINVLSIFLDKEKNLWLSLDNGIDLIVYNNAIKHIYPDYMNEGSGYAAAIFKNQLYIGTSNGLFRTTLYPENDLSYVKNVFEPVKNAKGQVYNLSEVNGKLLMGHHEGAFEIIGNEARLIDKASGFWTFHPFGNVLPSSLMIAGTYQGVNFYNYANGSFTHSGLNAQFESSRFIVVDDDHAWISHPYKGVYRVKLQNGSQPVVEKFGEKQGVTSVNHNYIFKVKNKIILTSEQGIFEYSSLNQKFEPAAFYNELFSDKLIRYLKEDNMGNIWFVFDKVLGVIDMSGQKPQLVYFPELTNKYVSGFEHVYPVNSNNVFIGGEKGFYHINYELYKRLRFPLNVHISSVKAKKDKDSLLFGGYISEINSGEQTQLKKHEISHAWNSFAFTFAAPVYAQQSNITYSYFLEGFDETWSEFSQKAEKEYTNLPAGNYTFHVKARNNLGNESQASTYSFVVMPAWYQSIWAKIAYVLIALTVGYLLFRYQRKKFKRQLQMHKEEQERLQYLHQLEMDKTEKELVKLRNEKLEAEIRHKNTELASVAMHLVQKGEFVEKIRDQLLKLRKATDGNHNKELDDFKKIIRSISDEDKLDKQWEQFAMHFDSVHSDFLVALKKKYSQLTPNELKLCAYLRMNLATKEIAQLMNISVRGVEISRYRLRKKLNVPTQSNLFNFLMEMDPGSVTRLS